MQKLNKTYPHLNILQVFPAAIEAELKDDLNESRDKSHRPGHVDRASATVYDFDIVLGALESVEKYTGRDFGVQEMVWKTAMEGTYQLKGYLTNEGGCRVGSPVGYWTVLRDCIKQRKAKTFDWDDENAVEAYKKSYKVCKGHYIAHQKCIVSTTGNVRCSEIVDYWARDLYGTECYGIAIVVDEACKDREIDTLAMMPSEEHIDKIRGIIMLGDETHVQHAFTSEKALRLTNVIRQLAPTNMSSKDKAEFNTFPERESIALFAPLKGQGFPCTELKEQHRMVSEISPTTT